MFSFLNYSTTHTHATHSDGLIDPRYCSRTKNIQLNCVAIPKTSTLSRRVTHQAVVWIWWTHHCPYDISVREWLEDVFPRYSSKSLMKNECKEFVINFPPPLPPSRPCPIKIVKFINIQIHNKGWFMFYVTRIITYQLHNISFIEFSKKGAYSLKKCKCVYNQCLKDISSRIS